MFVNSLRKTVTRQRRGCDLNPGPSAPESSTLTTRLPSHPFRTIVDQYLRLRARLTTATAPSVTVGNSEPIERVNARRVGGRRDRFCD